MVGYHKRSDPATAYARQIIDELKASAELGPMKYVRILMPAGDFIANGLAGMLKTDEQFPPLESEGRPPDMDDQTAKKYVAFVNYYIHQVNLMRHLMTEPYEVAYADPSGVLLAVRSKSGVPGVIEMTPYRTTVDWQESVLVAFEKGYVRLRLPPPLACNRAGTVEIYKDPGKGKMPQRTEPTFPHVHAMLQQAVNFVKVCKGEMAPPCQASEAVEDLRIARDYIRLHAASAAN